MLGVMEGLNTKGKRKDRELMDIENSVVIAGVCVWRGVDGSGRGHRGDQW